MNGDGSGSAGMGRGLVSYFAHNRVAANVLMLLLVGGGLFASSQVAVERFPEYNPHSIVVTVPYPGATQREIEDDITRRIEESVSGIVGVERVLSTAAEGFGRVTIEHEPFADSIAVLNAVRTAVDRIENFPPPNAERPEVLRSEVVRKVLTLAVSSSQLDEDGLRKDAEALRDELLALPNVSIVSLQGARDREIQIELSEEALQRLDLTIDRVVGQIQQSSVNLSGGELRTDAGEVVLSTITKRLRAEDFADIELVAQATGAVVRLRDVAVLKDGFVDEDLISEIDGRPTVFVRVDADVGQATQDVSEEILRFLSGYAPPPGTDVMLWQEEAKVTADRVSTMVGNAIIGAVLVFIALLLIFDFRFALWIALGIPISLIGSLAFFDLLGITINALTMFGFFVVIGIVVDDAVVVGESIIKQHESGLKGAAASIAGVSAVGGPVFVGALTTVATFFALFALDDAWGQLVRVIPLVVAAVLFVSLLEAFCILPAHLSGQKAWSRSPLKEFQATMRGAFDEFVNGKIVRAIAWAVRFPYLTVLAVVLAVAISAGLMASGVIGYSTFGANVGTDRFRALLTMPIGTQFKATAAAAERLAEAAREADQAVDGQTVASVAVLVGRHWPMETYEGMERSRRGNHLATVEVLFNPPDVRTITAEDFERLWRRAAEGILGVQSISFQATEDPSSSSSSYLLMHEDEEVLFDAATDMSDAYAAMDAVRETEHSMQLGKRRYDIQLTPTGVAAGLTAAQIAGQLRDAFFGAEAQRIQRGRDEIRVVVRYPSERRRSLRDLMDEAITIPTGNVPLFTVATIAETRDYAQRLHVDGRRAATVTGWLDTAIAPSRIVNAEIEANTVPTLLARYPGLEIRQHGGTRDNTKMLSTLAWSFSLALLVVYGLLASQLRSFGQPLLALAGLPMAAVGALVGHLVLGYDLTNMSLFGIVAVSGVVVNDTLILLDRYNRIRIDDPNIPQVAAISAAARHRARAIVLTTATTVVGLLPMLYDKSEEVQTLVPMVISLGAGLVFASLGVLFLVPAVLIIGEMVVSSAAFRLLGSRPNAAQA